MTTNFSLIIYYMIIIHDNSLQAKRHKCRAHGQFMIIRVQKINLCISVVSVGNYSFYSSYLCSKIKSV